MHRHKLIEHYAVKCNTNQIGENKREIKAHQERDCPAQSSRPRGILHRGWRGGEWGCLQMLSRKLRGVQAKRMGSPGQGWPVHVLSCSAYLAGCFAGPNVACARVTAFPRERSRYY